LTWLGLPVLLGSSWMGLPDATADIAVKMAPGLSLLMPAGMLISLFSAWMLARGRHLNTLLESVPALAILLAVLVTTGRGAFPLVWGTLAGFVLHMGFLGLALLQKDELGIPKLPAQSPWWGPFWQSFGVMLAGQALISLTAIIDQFFAARLETGSIATLGYANRVLALILGLGATAVSRSTLPVFSQVHASGQGQLGRVAAQWSAFLFVLGLLAVLVGWWAAEDGVRLLFERGAFTVRSTEAVAEVLRFGLFQLPFYFAAIVLVSLLASQGRHGSIAVAAAVGLIFKIAALLVLKPLLGLNGVALSTAVMYTGILLSLTVMARGSKN
jgi:putative peptidoglycan lipid II flippase